MPLAGFEPATKGLWNLYSDRWVKGAYKTGGRGGTRILTPLLATDFLTTITFVTLSVCSLDFTLTIASALGSCRQVSTPSSFDAWLGIRILHPSPTLTSYIWKVSQSKLKFLQVRCVCHFTTRPLNFILSKIFSDYFYKVQITFTNLPPYYQLF